MYRRMSDELEVFLVHPGGPIWAKKDKGAWTIPKGEYEQDENPLVAARREFEEEIGAWLDALDARAAKNVIVVAKANKLVRIAWAVLSRGEDYRPNSNMVTAS
jgi:predicted NUDIX family NTP pyrophosphohydrolase